MGQKEVIALVKMGFFKKEKEFMLLFQSIKLSIYCLLSVFTTYFCYVGGR